MSDWDTIYLEAMEDQQAREEANQPAVESIEHDGDWECPECFNEGTWNGCVLCRVVNGED